MHVGDVGFGFGAEVNVFKNQESRPYSQESTGMRYYALCFSGAHIGINIKSALFGDGDPSSYTLEWFRV